jgi:hypothetical protein
MFFFRFVLASRRCRTSVWLWPRWPCDTLPPSSPVRLRPTGMAARRALVADATGSLPIAALPTSTRPTTARAACTAALIAMPVVTAISSGRASRIAGFALRQFRQIAAGPNRLSQ